MKRNWVSLGSLALSVVLLAVVAWQGTAIRQLRTDLADSRQEAEELSEQVNETESALETVQAVQNARAPSVIFSNASVNTMDHMLTVDIWLELPQSVGSYANIGLCCVGEPYRAAWDILFLEAQGNGIYTGTATFALDLEGGIELRLEDDTVLYSCDSVTALLPLQMASGGASWHYNETLRRFYMLDCVPDLRDLQGREAQVTDGVCRVYRNGELVIEEPYFRESETETQNGHPFIDEGFSLDCDPGDHIRLCYVCTDDFGLRYEFPLQEWVAQRWDDAAAYPLSARPTVTWPA